MPRLGSSNSNLLEPAKTAPTRQLDFLRRMSSLILPRLCLPSNRRCRKECQDFAFGPLLPPVFFPRPRLASPCSRATRQPAGGRASFRGPVARPDLGPYPATRPTRGSPTLPSSLKRRKRRVPQSLPLSTLPLADEEMGRVSLFNQASGGLTLSSS